MKSRIGKIIIGAAALVFLSSSVSFAHDWHKRHHKRHGKTYSHHKSEKHFKPWKHRWKHHRKHHHRHYRRNHLAGYWCKYGFYHYYDKRSHRWRSDHFKPRKHHRHRYGYRKSYHENDTHHRRQVPREDAFFKVAFKNHRIGVTVLKDGRKIYR